MSKQNNSETSAKVVGFIIGLFLCALLYKWYEYVWFGTHLGYSKLLLLAVGSSLLSLTVGWFKHVLGVVFVLTVLAQLFHWVGLLGFPIFH